MTERVDRELAPPLAPLAPARRWDEPAVLACLALIVVGAVWLGVLSGPDVPGERSADAGFARDMATHHEQAVAMAEAIRARAPTPEVAVLATDIALTQQAQIGRMRGWLDTWGLPPTGRDLPMAWMGHPMAGLMPGMARRAELAALATAPAADAEAEFLRLMIRHHKGGVLMAEGALARARRPEVRQLAQGIIAAQQSEITLMTEMLRARGAAPPVDGPTMPAMVAPAEAGPVWRAVLRVAPASAAALAALWLVADAAWRRRAWSGPVRRMPIRRRWPSLTAAAALAAAAAIHVGVAAAVAPAGGDWLYVGAAGVELAAAAVLATWPARALRAGVVGAAALAVVAVPLLASAVLDATPPTTVVVAVVAAQLLAAATAGAASLVAEPAP